jgi:hypothetical protein
MHNIYLIRYLSGGEHVVRKMFTSWKPGSQEREEESRVPISPSRGY